jgi:hypothetical protein
MSTKVGRKIIHLRREIIKNFNTPNINDETRLHEGKSTNGLEPSPNGRRQDLVLRNQIKRP